MPFCTQCGKEYQEDAAFCPACGEKLGKQQRQPEPHIEAAGEKIKSAANLAAVATKELAQVPNIAMNITIGLGILGIVLFFFPWARAMFWTFSGLKIALHPNDFGVFVLLLLLMPIAFGFGVYYAWQVRNAAISPEEAGKFIGSAGAAAFIAQGLVYLIASNRLGGLDVFTGWFYLEFLVSAGMFGSIFINKSRVERKAH